MVIMKRLVFLFLLMFVGNLSATLEFIYNKEKGALSTSFLEEMQELFHPDIFFETGTHHGLTTAKAIPYFDRVVTVELEKTLAKRAQYQFLSNSSVTVYQGSSPKIIKEIGPELKGRVLFWLDAHHSGGDTALDVQAASPASQITPIRAELNNIYEAGIRDCIILIDDVRAFGSKFCGREYVACWAHPLIQEVETALLKINPDFKILLLGDILLAYDVSRHAPMYSDVIDACTKLRFYDGNNLTDGDLDCLDQKIMRASYQEQQFIKGLCEMSPNNLPMPHLWMGLVDLGNKRLASALSRFQTVKKLLMHNCTLYDSESSNNFDNYLKRVDGYIEFCKAGGCVEKIPD